MAKQTFFPPMDPQGVFFLVLRRFCLRGPNKTLSNIYNIDRTFLSPT